MKNIRTKLVLAKDTDKAEKRKSGSLGLSQAASVFTDAYAPAIEAYRQNLEAYWQQQAERLNGTVPPIATWGSNWRNVQVTTGTEAYRIVELTDE